jgi:uncharacterized protein (TIGR02145 family)
MDFCAGSGGVAFALSGTESGRDYQLYRDNLEVDDAVLNGRGSAETFTGSFNKAGTYTALSIADELYCATAMSGSHVIVKNPLPANPAEKNGSRNCPGTVTLSASSSSAVIDWYADDVTTSILHTGESYTTPEIATSTTYYVQARVESTGCVSARVPVSATVNMEGCCTAPGATVNFTAFNPCANAETYSVWYLTDTREASLNNTQTYKIKKMADGRIWMVQDMKFGNLCNKDTYSGSKGKDQTSKVTELDDKTYYGDCTNYRLSNTPSERGYLYDWAAAINQSGAYYAGVTGIGCSGTGSAANACQGICPTNWHVPTGSTNSEMSALLSSLGCASYFRCSLSASQFEGSGCSCIEDAPQTTATYYSSSTPSAHEANLMCEGSSGCCDNERNYRYSLIALRCIMNQ